MTISKNKTIPTVPIDSDITQENNIRQFLTQSYLKYGPVFRTQSPEKETIVLAGIEANRFASKYDGKVWRAFEIFQSFAQNLNVERILLSMDGPEHRQMRKVIRRALGRGYFAERSELAYRAINQDMQALKLGQEFTVTPWCQALIMEQLSQTAVSRTSRSSFHDVRTYVRTLFMSSFTDDPPASFTTPEFLEAKQKVFALSDELIAHHRQTPAGTDRKADLIDDLLEAQQQDPEFWSTDDIRAAALTTFLAGLDTAANTLAFVLYRVYKHPEVLQRIRQEVDELFSSGLPSLEALGKAPELHNTVLETLRLHPIAPMIIRFTIQDFEFAGYNIPKDHPIMIGTTVVHGLDEIYKDPERFDPSRFGKDRAEHRKAGVFHPFGVGPHTCLGSGLAESLLLLNTATIVHTLDLHLEPTYELQVDQQPTPHPDSSFKLHVNDYRHSLPLT